MVRTTIYLPEHLHHNLKHMAVERHHSMAHLLREAVEEVYEQDMKDLRKAHQAWKVHLRHPGKAVSARAYFAKRSKRV